MTRKNKIFELKKLLTQYEDEAEHLSEMGQPWSNADSTIISQQQEIVEGLWNKIIEFVSYMDMDFHV